MTYTVYALTSAKGDYLYVGHSQDVDRRLREHAREPWFADVANTETWHYDEKADALTQERHLIRLLVPLHNRLSVLSDGEPTAGQRKRDALDALVKASQR